MKPPGPLFPLACKSAPLCWVTMGACKCTWPPAAPSTAAAFAVTTAVLVMLRLWPALIETVPPDALLITLLATVLLAVALFTEVLLTAELICRGDGGGAKVRLMAGVKLKVLLVEPLVVPPVAAAELLDALLDALLAEPVDAPALEPAATLMMVV